MKTIVGFGLFGGPFLSVFMILTGFFIINETPSLSKTFNRIKHIVLIWIKAKLVY